MLFPMNRLEDISWAHFGEKVLGLRALGVYEKLVFKVRPEVYRKLLCDVAERERFIVTNHSDSSECLADFSMNFEIHKGEELSLEEQVAELRREVRLLAKRQ